MKGQRGKGRCWLRMRGFWILKGVFFDMVRGDHAEGGG
jgi:hypothetical protein